jgi:hypothetical protein
VSAADGDNHRKNNTRVPSAAGKIPLQPTPSPPFPLRQWSAFAKLLLQKSPTTQHATLQFSRVSQQRVEVLSDKTSKHRCVRKRGRRILSNPFASRLSYAFKIPLTRSLSPSLSLSPNPHRSLPTPCSSNRIPGACKFASGRGSRIEGPPSSPDGETAGDTLRLRGIKRAATAPPPLSSPQNTLSLLLPHQPQQAEVFFFHPIFHDDLRLPPCL